MKRRKTPATEASLWGLAVYSLGFFALMIVGIPLGAVFIHRVLG